MNRKIFVLIAIAVLGLAGCQKDDEYTGKGIRFGVLSGTEGTKTYYGAVSGTGTNKTQAINWAVGDLVRVYCAEASAPADNFADYVVADASPELNENGNSEGKIKPTDDDPLLWSETANTAHNFYAVYPSPATDGVASGFAMDKTKVTTVFPEVLDVIADIEEVEYDDDYNYVVTPDMRYLYMVAKTVNVTEAQAGNQTVFLSFFPAATAIQFTISNGFASEGDMKVTEVFLSSPDTLWGTTSTDLASWNYPTAKPVFSVPADGDKKVGLKLGTTSDPLVVKYKHDVTFTFFLPPYANATNLTFGITGFNGTEPFTRTTALSYDTGTSIEFAAFKKHFVKGILVPEGATWIVGGDVVVTPWTANPVDLDFDE